VKPAKLPYTEKQGQYLTFIHRYIKTRGYSPSESDIQMHFGVAGPTIHQMIVRLETMGLIEKIPYTARSIRLLLREDQLPAAVAARAGSPPRSKENHALYLDTGAIPGVHSPLREGPWVSAGRVGYPALFRRLRALGTSDDCDPNQARPRGSDSAHPTFDSRASAAGPTPVAGIAQPMPRTFPKHSIWRE
jgi:hypothetical protein